VVTSSLARTSPDYAAMKPQDEEAGGPLLNTIIGQTKIKPAATTFLGSPTSPLPRHNTFNSNASSVQTLSR
jgi:hypothetical protein